MQLFNWGHEKSSPLESACPQAIPILYYRLFFIFQVALSFGTPSFAPSSLLWFFSLISFSYNFSTGTHVLQFCLPKTKDMCIVDIDIYCNLTINTKRIIQIQKKNFFANNLYLHVLETFSELSSLFASV